MNPVILKECKKFTAGLADKNAYMMEMAKAKPIIETQAKNIFLIDIRPETVYKAGHIPGSFSFPLANIVDKIEEIPLDKTVFVVCTLDAMSAYATMTLHLLGYQAILVQGGVPAWAEAGGPLEKS